MVDLVCCLTKLLSVSELFYHELFDTFLILSTAVLPTISLVPSAVFWIVLFETVLARSAANILVWSISFWLCLLFKFFPYF